MSAQKPTKRDSDDFLQTVQSHVARVAVVPSAVRGAGNKGVVLVSRSFLRSLDLAQFADATAFPLALDNATDTLRRRFPKGARHWGLARKVMNLFLRDCLYNGYRVSLWSF